MTTRLYRFDDIEALPILESRTTVRGGVVTNVRSAGEEAEVTLTLARHPADPTDACVMLALPIIAVDGMPERLGLTIRGDGSGVRPFLEAGDAEVGGFIYRFERINTTGVGTHWVDVVNPSEWLGERQTQEGEATIAPPLRLYRLGFTIGDAAKGLAIGLRGIVVTGEVRLTSPGIA